MEERLKNSEVEKELGQLVNVIMNVVPSVREIRLFGSYGSEKWDALNSDINIYLELNGRRYLFSKEFTDERKDIINKTKEKIAGNYKDRFNIAIHSEDSLYQHPFSYSFAKEVRSDRLLYMKNYRRFLEGIRGGIVQK